MTSKKTLRHGFKPIRALSLATALVFLSPPALAGSFQCHNQPNAVDAVACYGVTALVIVLGAGSAILNSIKSAISPNIDVLVSLDSGEIIQGQVTSKAAQGRVVRPGDVVTLKCKYETTIDKIEPLCTLFFAELKPNPHSADYYEKRGHQAPYYVAVSEGGIPEKSILTLERPLRWKDGRGN